MADLSFADCGAARHGSASRSQQYMKVEVCGMTKSCLEMVWELEGSNHARSLTKLTVLRQHTAFSELCANEARLQSRCLRADR